MQSKIESLSGENERLKKALVDARDEIARLSSLVGSTGVIGVGGPGVQPVSMNVTVSTRQNGAAAVSGPGARASGYGY